MLWGQRISVAWFLPACDVQDYAIREPGVDASGAPVVRLEPETLYLGAAAEGESLPGEIRVYNDGDATLSVKSLALEGSTEFTLDAAAAASVPPGGFLPVPVRYRPVGLHGSATLVVESNAPTVPEARALVYADGLYPSLALRPLPVDFHYTDVACGETLPLELVNAGLAPLSVESILVVGEPFSVGQVPPLPLSLDPGASATVLLRADPRGPDTYTADLYITSNDPTSPRTEVLATIGSRAPAEVIQDFRQPDGPWDEVDVLVYIDQSGSMSDDQRRLAQNFELLAESFDALLASYQVMVVVADDGCNSGGIITPYSGDAGEVFSRAVRSGGGTWTEAGLTLAEEALGQVGRGECNAGFLRPSAKTLLLMVSDEPEQSSGYWRDHVDAILAMAPTAAVVAVVGDVPGGCRSAAPGTGYVEAASYTGGVFFSICEDDWSGYFGEMALLGSAGPVDRVALDWTPKLSTLVVTADGRVETRWTYDERSQELAFDAAGVPPPGSWVEIRYQVAEDCDR
jgi:hypothetical protein